MTDMQYLMKGVKSIDELVPLGPSGAGGIARDLRIEDALKITGIASSLPEYLVREYHALHKTQQEIADGLNKILGENPPVISRYRVLRWFDKYNIPKKSMSEAKMANPKTVRVKDPEARATILRGDEPDAYMMLEATLQQATGIESLQDFVCERKQVDCTRITEEIDRCISPLTGHLPYTHNSRLRRLVVACKFNLPINNVTNK